MLDERLCHGILYVLYTIQVRGENLIPDLLKEMINGALVVGEGILSE